MINNKALVVAALLAAGIASSAQALTITPAVEYASAGSLSDSRPFTLGYSFSLTSATAINALGYWDDGLTNAHQVGIWNSAGALLGSTTVNGTDALVGHFRWSAISLNLAPGNYVIGGEYLGNNDPFIFNATGIVSIAQYVYGTDFQTFGAGLNFPTNGTGGGYGNNGILLASFSVGGAVPEPTSWAMLIGGFAMVGVAARRRRTVVAA